MANPLFDKLGGLSYPQVNSHLGAYNDLLNRAQQMAQTLPPTFNPQSIIQNMLNSHQVSQDQLNQAMSIANKLTGRG